ERNRAQRVWLFNQITTELQALRQSATDPSRLAPFRNGSVFSPKAQGEVVGDIMISLLMPAANKVQDAADRTVQTFDNTVTAFAIAWYARDNGKYPDTLDQLAPKYLAQAPKDLFTGGALIYRPQGNGYVLYSVGVNGRDDGGRGYDDQ